MEVRLSTECRSRTTVTIHWYLYLGTTRLLSGDYEFLCVMYGLSGASGK